MNDSVHRRRRRGSNLIEFTLAGIPLIFVLVSIIEIARVMWAFHTVAYGVKEGVRFAQVHGINCVSVATPNNCPTTIAQVTRVIRDAAVGLDPAQTSLTFTPGTTDSTPTKCSMGGAGAGDCPQLTGTWPPNDSTGAFNAVGKPIRIDISTQVPNAISLVYPGTRFATFTFVASATDYIQF
jgi:hypothetical protein